MVAANQSPVQQTSASVPLVCEVLSTAPHTLHAENRQGPKAINTSLELVHPLHLFMPIAFVAC